jgi:hypothetical protein
MNQEQFNENTIVFPSSLQQQQQQPKQGNPLAAFLSLQSEENIIQPEPPALKSKGRQRSDDDSETSSTSNLSEEPQFPTGPVVPPTKEDLQQLSDALKSWNTTFEKINQARQTIKEESKRQKHLESLIVTMMKNHAIGALDLKASGARVLYKKQKKTTGVKKKEMLPLLSEHLGDEKKAKEVIAMLEKHKTTEWKEGLRYEKLDGGEDDE